MERPSKIYKYQPFTALTLSNLKQRIIYFADPSCFNDPFDCRYRFEDADVTPAELSAIVEQFALDKGLDAASHLEALKSDDRAADRWRKLVIDTGAASLRSYFGTRGICCFSAIRDDVLMWGHYADGHRGFCLEFDATDPMFEKLFPVKYQDDYPTYSPADVLLRQEGQKMLDLALLTKSTHWAYEHEWRAIHENAGQEFGYPVTALTGVYFGAEMPFIHQELLALVVRGSGTKLYRTLRGHRTYALSFESVEYTPHPDAGGGGA